MYYSRLFPQEDTRVKKLVRITVPFFVIVLLSAIYSTVHVMAQSIPLKKPFAFKVNKPQTLDSQNVAVMITWLDSDNGKYSLLFQVNSYKGVYYVVRFCPKGIVSFGYSKEFLAGVVEKGVMLQNEGVIDFEKPFVMREGGKKVAIFQEQGQTVDKLFYTLNQLYRKSVLPSMQGLPHDVEGLSNVEIEKSIMFQSPPNWWWTRERFPLLFA